MQSLAIATDLLAGELAVSAEEGGWTFNWLGSQDLPVEAVLHMWPSVWDGRTDRSERQDEADREDQGEAGGGRHHVGWRPPSTLPRGQPRRRV